MDCPRCQHALLHEQDREGVTIDKCETCRGIWLDRGELEKLMARRPLPDRYWQESARDPDDDDEDGA